MKMRKCLLLTMLAGLAACNTMNYQASAPTAAPELVAVLQDELKEIQDLKVTDEGYIDYYVWVPEGYQWDTHAIKKGGYEWACEDMINALRQGFVVRMGFKGKGGREEHYDFARCEQEASN
ncbi:hypothetical protein EWS92_18445 [Vibrio vulnificus]|uniref:hypothetical protein n=1 Tax=Vibrio vulnificus TaxID=672 RepID=UPI00102C6799|nr:hypothetical protein [Vibrio vulnificus]EGR0789444.1 hypothetical protein [Vibrio vulnificus]EGR0798988.1 hypothetical protein [Vibrio vulnificus]EGR0816013.1 hypothetical protein [Vibrio vulnificus]EGR0828263.1 hypothetical protein [Vibrio vulnificus]EGR0848949.1 hypothetical protein [Vibrio vulnificus]